MQLNNRRSCTSRVFACSGTATETITHAALLPDFRRVRSLNGNRLNERICVLFVVVVQTIFASSSLSRSSNVCSCQQRLAVRRIRIIVRQRLPLFRKTVLCRRVYAFSNDRFGYWNPRFLRVFRSVLAGLFLKTFDGHVQLDIFLTNSLKTQTTEPYTYTGYL